MQRGLVGSVRLVVLGVAFLGVLVGVAVAVGFLGGPAVEGVENRFGGVNGTTTVVETDVLVSNPTPVGGSLGDVVVDYGVGMNGIGMANGTKRGVSVDRGTTRVPFTSRMSNERIPAWWASHVRTASGPPSPWTPASARRRSDWRTTHRRSAGR